MVEITKEELLKHTEAERCRVLVKIINGEIKYVTDKTEEKVII